MNIESNFKMLLYADDEPLCEYFNYNSRAIIVINFSEKKSAENTSWAFL